MIIEHFRPDMTVREAQDRLRELVEDGHTCPVCTLFAKVYKHRLDSAMARTLIVMYHRGGRVEHIHVPSLPGDNHKVSQLRWWELVHEAPVGRDDGGKAGYWRLTEGGIAFVERRCLIPKYARIYDARVLGFEGEQVGIEDCLGKRFNYNELMSR